MNEGYFQASLGQLGQRASLLLLRVPRDTPPEFRPLVQVCHDRLQNIINRLESLRTEKKYLVPTAQRERLDLYRSAVEALVLIETAGIAALERQQGDEPFLNGVLDDITREIRYPLLPPMVSCLSRDYFHIYTQFNLICVPLAESRHLLHWPDLYHELCHAILAEKIHPAVAPFKRAMGEAHALVQNHFLSAAQRLQLTKHPPALLANFTLWQECWTESWLDEFFCDLFAVFALGPAYAWAHLHLCAQERTGLFDVPTMELPAHPSNGARLQMLLMALDHTGFSTDAGQLRQRWDQLTGILEESADPDHDYCYPRELISQIVDLCHTGFVAMGCRQAKENGPAAIQSLLTEAWRAFWTDPANYPAWEEAALRKLRAQKAPRTGAR